MKKNIGSWCKIKDLKLFQTVVRDAPLDDYIFVLMAEKTSHGKKYGLVCCTWLGDSGEIWQVPMNKLIFQIKERK